MNLKTGILLIVFCVALGGVIVGQRLKIRSVAFESGQLEREVRQSKERNRVLSVELARKSDPLAMVLRVREAGLNILPPDQEDPPPATPPRRRG